MITVTQIDYKLQILAKYISYVRRYVIRHNIVRARISVHLIHIRRDNLYKYNYVRFSYCGECKNGNVYVYNFCRKSPSIALNRGRMPTGFATCRLIYPSNSVTYSFCSNGIVKNNVSFNICICGLLLFRNNLIVLLTLL